MKTLYNIALTLVIVGALNWLLIGLFNFDLVATLFGTMSVLSRIIYSLVSLNSINLQVKTMIKGKEGKI